MIDAAITLLEKRPEKIFRPWTNFEPTTFALPLRSGIFFQLCYVCIRIYRVYISLLLLDICYEVVYEITKWKCDNKIFYILLLLSVTTRAVIGWL